MSAPEDPVSEPSSAADLALERAQARLDEACARVAARFDELASGPHREPDAGADADLSAALGEARRREAALAEAAEAASSALDDAMAELRALQGGRS